METGFVEVEIETQETTGGREEIECLGEEGRRGRTKEDVIHVGMDGGEMVR